MNLYQAELTDHYRNPRNWGSLQDHDFSSGQHNPSCGDSVVFEGCITANAVTSLVFMGKGCVISLATASMLSQVALNKDVAWLMALNKEYIIGLIGIDLGPTRLKCALLSIEALQHGISSTVVAKDSHVRSR
jgi:nitrogen fixation NifU-like protein